ncbi:c-type cytochrome [Citreimonas salinaria]|uniref:Cytochrome C oxidase, cbb3-type, subunit III n=1 Tax=Citreimonas salinaria TaxID=321339 RepID=A0A1H3LSI7_9RHOB|nr:cytochrome c [Citreimonas salinaria]SDY67323.1 Cytochrome C oxidase, cbb3-type, subunit III [Citreimonas salinaria]
MNPIKTTILPFALLAAGMATAQENLPPVEVPEGEPVSEFRTFDPTEEEFENFRGAGNIPHEGGEAVYNAVCSGCHMPDGQGAVGAGEYPALADNELLAAPGYPIYMVVHGQAAMPPFGSLLDDQQIADVVNYVRSHFGNDFVEGEFGEAAPEDVAATRE